MSCFGFYLRDGPRVAISTLHQTLTTLTRGDIAMTLVLLDCNPFKFLKTTCWSMIVGLIFFITVKSVSTPKFCNYSVYCIAV